MVITNFFDHGLHRLHGQEKIIQYLNNLKNTPRPKGRPTRHTRVQRSQEGI